KAPKILCNRIAIVIISCSLIIRVLSIGYVVGGFVLKYHEHLLSDDSIEALNVVSIGSLPVGSFLNALFLSLIPTIIVHTVNAAVTFCGICTQNKRCLIASAIINVILVIFNLIVIALISWLLDELYSTILESLRWNFPGEINQLTIAMKCCGFDIKSTACPYDCNTYIADTINTYGSSYIAVLVINVIVSVIMIVGTEYLHRFIIARSHEKNNQPLGNVIEKSEMHKIKNGVCANFCSLVKVHWTESKLTSCFGFLTFSSMILELGMILAIIFIRYNYYDITMTTELYRFTREYHINMGYLKDALLITVVCLLIWSIISKALCLFGMYFKRKFLFLINIITDIVVLTAECVVLVFASYLLRTLYCCFWNNIDMCQFDYEDTTPIPMCTTSWDNAALFIWCSTGILIFHIFLKVLFVGMADRVYKHYMSTLAMKDDEKSVEIHGFFLTVFSKMRRHPFISIIVGLSILITAMDLIIFCGLLVIRYGYSSYKLLRRIMDAISLGPLNMSTNRDNTILMMLAVTSFSFFLQVGKFISLGLQKPKATLLILWKEVVVVALLIAVLGLISVQANLVVCCNAASENCYFTYEIDYYTNRNASDLFCDRENPDVFSAVEIETWLMLGFTLFLILMQVVCTILGYIYYKRSPEGYLGIFKGIVELFKSMWFEITNNRLINDKTMPNYRKQFGIFCLLTGFNMILEFTFAVSIYAYYFTEGDSSGMLRLLNWFSYFRYNMESAYKGVAYTMMVIIPLAIGLHIAAFCWLLMKRTTVALYIILGFLLFWTVGEVIVLRYASYSLQLAYDCSDSLYSYKTTDWWWLQPSPSTLCDQYSSRMFNQCGIIIGYLVVHIILNIGMTLLLDAMYPHVRQDHNTNRLSKRLWIRLLEVKKQNIVKKINIGVHTLSQILNAVIWIGLILMVLIPGYIHTDHVCSTAKSKKDTVLGMAYALIAVVPLSSINQILGIICLIKQKKMALNLYIVFSVIFTIVHFVFLIFSAIFLHAMCRAAGAYYMSSWVLVSYLAITIILQITSLICSIKISRRKISRIGISEETTNLTEDMELTHVLEENDAVQNHREDMSITTPVEETGPSINQTIDLATSLMGEKGIHMNNTGGISKSTMDENGPNITKEDDMPTEAEENGSNINQTGDLATSLVENSGTDENQTGDMSYAVNRNNTHVDPTSHMATSDVDENALHINQMDGKETATSEMDENSLLENQLVRKETRMSIEEDNSLLKIQTEEMTTTVKEENF
ncbi:uncharacterized protein LOC134249945, partial [Saccostrea cucullata]|uniref:uncharacterized protein LOC134249945 n=1 Tax=Saccostrea cuccullata TaxID=36930 RepID=UPI002ED416CA